MTASPITPIPHSITPDTPLIISISQMFPLSLMCPISDLPPLITLLNPQIITLITPLVPQVTTVPPVVSVTPIHTIPISHVLVLAQSATMEHVV